MIKLLRCFFNYLINEKGMNVGFFHKKFYAPQEDIEIHVLTPERLNFLINNESIYKSIDAELKTVRDIFIFGCSVALRYSDLMSLKKSNVEYVNDRVYINMKSKKTNTFTKVKLPDYAIRVLEKYSKQYAQRILPYHTKVNLNKKIKLLMEAYGFNEEIVKTRQKRGIPVPAFRKTETKLQYRFCDVITTHTMRRTAITTMLSLGMNEHTVRQISGHAASSKEFFRYVSYAQTYIDNEVDNMHQKLNEKQLDLA